MHKTLLAAALALSTSGCFGHVAVMHKWNSVSCSRHADVNAFGYLQKTHCASDAQFAKAVAESDGEY